MHASNFESGSSLDAPAVQIPLHAYTSQRIISGIPWVSLLFKHNPNGEYGLLFPPSLSSGLHFPSLPCQCSHMPSFHTINPLPYIGEIKISSVHLSVRKRARRVHSVWRDVWAGGGAIARVGGTDFVSGSSPCTSSALTRSCPAHHRANFCSWGLKFLLEKAGRKRTALEGARVIP